MREAFYSAAGTPRSLSAHSPSTSFTNLNGHKQKHPTWLDMTYAGNSSKENGNAPKMTANGLQLASPMMSPKRSNFDDTQQTQSASSTRSAFDANGQESLEENYYEHDDSDSATSKEKEDAWDQESLSSVNSDASGTVVPDTGRQSRPTSARNSPTTTYDQSRASSLARLRSQLEQNDLSKTPPDRSRNSGTLVSIVFPLVLHHARANALFRSHPIMQIIHSTAILQRVTSQEFHHQQ